MRTGIEGEMSRGTGRLAILLPDVWTLRNVLHSGITRKLCDQGIEIGPETFVRLTTRG